MTTRELFQRHPEVKKLLWGEAFWSSVYFVDTVSKFGSESITSKYDHYHGMDNEFNMLHKKDLMKQFIKNLTKKPFITKL